MKTLFGHQHVSPVIHWRVTRPSWTWPLSDGHVTTSVYYVYIMWSSLNSIKYGKRIWDLTLAWLKWFFLYIQHWNLQLLNYGIIINIKHRYLIQNYGSSPSWIDNLCRFSIPVYALLFSGSERLVNFALRVNNYDICGISRKWFDLIWFLVFNATFSNISAI
jgi:hypothetical protein